MLGSFIIPGRTTHCFHISSILSFINSRFLFKGLPVVGFNRFELSLLAIAWANFHILALPLSPYFTRCIFLHVSLYIHLAAPSGHTDFAAIKSDLITPPLYFPPSIITRTLFYYITCAYMVGFGDL